MKIRLALAGMIALSSGFSSVSAQAWSPDMPTIQRLESNIHPNDFPKWGYAGQPPALAAYARFYAGYRKDGHRLIAGEFVLAEWADHKPAGVYVVASQENFPEIMDGSCGVIHVLYDSDTARMISLTCNGRA
jgi:hypothetical protein